MDFYFVRFKEKNKNKTILEPYLNCSWQLGQSSMEPKYSEGIICI